MSSPLPEGAGGGLLREVGLAGAVFMGLGSIIGTGLFVSLGIAAGVASGGILLALPLAALLALCNGLSSAQLAAAHPVSGGTYEYGYRVLSPAFGFSAGWTFLLAKGASAATAALGLGGYLLLLVGADPTRLLRTAVACGALLLLGVLLVGGIRRSNRVNLAIVSVTILIFGYFLAAGLPQGLAGLAADGRDGVLDPIRADGGPGALLHATALLFVAYTGYGRIATLGEEVRSPGTTIPRAIWITLFAVALLYVGVAVVALGTIGGEAFSRATDATAAPLRVVAEAVGAPGLPTLVGIAAVTAMLGVLLNLVLGLSRVALAMGRRGDLPSALARVHRESGAPRVAVGAVVAGIAVLALAGDVAVTWSVSAFSVLLYYGITNLAALRLPEEHRRYPRWVAVVGLGGCMLLAFQVDPRIWSTGTALLAGGLLLRHLARRRSGPG